MLDRIDFIVGEAFVALRRNLWMTFTAISTAAVALFLLGGFGLAYVSLSRYASGLPSKFEMRVFLKDGVTEPDIRQAITGIEAMKGVRSVKWIPRDQAWAEEQRRHPELTEGLENPLPHALAVTLDDLSRAPALSTSIQAMPNVAPNGVTYQEDAQRLIQEAMTLVRKVGVGLGGLMLLTSAVLIYNAIRLTILARRREIRIMSLVGATRATIVLPLLIEGMVQGMVGGMLATALLWSSHQTLQRVIAELSAFGNMGPFPTTPAFVALSLAGGAYGVACSMLAVREPRKMPA